MARASITFTDYNGSVIIGTENVLGKNKTLAQEGALMMFNEIKSKGEFNKRIKLAESSFSSCPCDHASKRACEQCQEPGRSIINEW